MLIGNQIPELVDLLNSRGVILYHSCQFTDFQSYWELGGIPSRKKLSEERKGFTRFETDGEDHNNGVWDKAFLNLQDFGEIFENGNGIPTVYGPIQLLVKPNALLEAEDVAIALRTAGSPGFNRKKESLSSVSDVERIFRHPSSASQKKRREIKWRDELKDEFKIEYACNPEISISLHSGLIPSSYISKVIIDNYNFGEKRLLDYMGYISEGKKRGILGQSRKYNTLQQRIVNDISRLLLDAGISLDDLANHPDANEETKKWAARMKEKELEIQWRRYVRYLREGTLLPVDKIVLLDWGLFKCIQCGKLVMGYEKEKHEKDIHIGKPVEWKRLK